MENTQIEVGDIVAISSEAIFNDGNRMTVDSVDDKEVSCIWYDNSANKYMQKSFKLSILILKDKKP